MDTRYTDIRLLKVPLEIDSKNQLTFANATAQANYFLSLNYLEVSDSSYQRKDSIIRYPENIDDLWAYNYVMYKNTNYSNKWFYAFITDMKYINDSMTEITIKTDVWQTWQFDIEYKNCFVEREHVNDDTVGKHTVPEGLETGEYITESSTASNFDKAHVVIAASWDFKNERPAGSFNNGIYQACMFYLIRQDTNQSITNAITTIWQLIKQFDDQDKGESILGLFMVPDEITDYDNISSWETFDSGLIYTQYKTLNLQLTGAKNMGDTTISKLYSTIDSYTPKNNKMFTFPYKYINGSNNQGTIAQYRYEDFSTSNCVFKTEGVLSPGCSIRNYPKNYKGKANNYDEGINLGKYPICSYTTDLYTNWLTQNALNVGLSTAGSVIATGVGIATGNPVAIASGVLGIAGSVSQVYEHSLTPPQFEGNINAGDVNYSSGNCDFTFNQMCIKKEYAQIIDNFFSMFGYKVNAVKTPNVTGRQNWNYVKTIDCNIHAYIPQADCLEIKNMFNAGVTFWHNPTTFLDYSQNNPIV